MFSKEIVKIEQFLTHSNENLRLFAKILVEEKIKHFYIRSIHSSFGRDTFIFRSKKKKIYLVVYDNELRLALFDFKLKSYDIALRISNDTDLREFIQKHMKNNP